MSHAFLKSAIKIQFLALPNPAFGAGLAKHIGL